MARRSAAALALIGPTGIETLERPKPPEYLSDEEASEWRSVVNSQAADWFGRETHALLVQQCRHTIAARRIAQIKSSMEADTENFDLDAYDRVLKMQERETRALCSLTTKMRLAQQTSYDKSHKKPKTSQKRPWD
jgi:hypothetical protein